MIFCPNVILSVGEEFMCYRYFDYIPVKKNDINTEV